MSQRFRWEIDTQVLDVSDMQIAMRVWCHGELLLATIRTIPVSADTFDIELNGYETTQISEADDPKALYDVIASVPGGGVNFVAKGPVEVLDGV